MRIVNLSLRSVFMLREYRESPSLEIRHYQALDHYESVLEVELEGKLFVAQRNLYQQLISAEEVKGLRRALRKDVSKQVEDHIFKEGLGVLEVTHPDLIGFPTKYACAVTVEGNRCEASFQVTEAFQNASAYDFNQRVEYQLKRQILNQIYAKLFEGWEV